MPLRPRSEVPPPPMRLGAAGLTWWAWAWSTPQASTWHDGFLDVLIKRAQLEDVWVRALDGEEDVDVCKIVPLMLKLDQEFGLTPRSASQLHYSFVEPEPEPEVRSEGVTDIRDRLKGMRS